MSDPPATIVPGNEEALMSELTYDFHLIKSHRTK